MFLWLAITVVCCAVSWLLYDQLGQQLGEKDSSFLHAAMDTQVSLLTAADAQPGSERMQGGWQQAMPRLGLSLRIRSPEGRVTEAGSPAGLLLLAYPPHEADAPLKRFDVHGDTRIGDYLTTSKLVRTRPGRVWLVQVAYNDDESETLLARFGRRIFELLIYTAAVSAVLGGWIVRRGLRPLRVMSAAISSITATNLDARIADGTLPSDLRQLARAFDDMLGRLRSAFEQLSRFSSDLAHEFRSPITSLVSAASVMLLRERSVLEYQETLAVVVEDGERLSRLVSSMLFLARAENAKQALDIERISILEQLQLLTEAYALVAEERGVRIESGGEGEVDADVVLLRSALSNLLTNALRYTPAGGSVTLSSRVRGAGVEILVVDTGCGIAADHLPHLFERFYRVDSARSESDRSGLGLALVRSIAELHGGRVEVRSALGEGSCFSLWIPFRA